jgi:hypothetical protein
MRRALTSVLTLVTFAVWASVALGQGRVHVRDVRVGAHPGFDRVVVELDGPTDIAWERGPKPGEESFYLDADLGSRGRVIQTKLAQVGALSVKAMRVGTHVALEPRERRVRVYVLSGPTRLVIDLAPPGPEEFAVPKGITPLAPATGIGPLEAGPAPEAEAQPQPGPEAQPEQEAQPEPEAEPQPAPAPPIAEAPVEGQPRGEPVEGAVEAAPEPAPPGAEMPPQAEVPPAESLPEATPTPAPAPTPPSPEPEVSASEPAPQLPPAAFEFPWLLVLASVGLLAVLAALFVAYRGRATRGESVARSLARKVTPLGVEGISREEIRFAADATGVIEQRLDQEVRARVALEERLTEASEELKVLRDRLNRVERTRDDTH